MDIITSCTLIDFIRFLLCDPSGYSKCTASLKKGFVFQTLRILSCEYPKEIYSLKGYENANALDCLHSRLCKKGQRLPQWVWEAVKGSKTETTTKTLKTFEKDVIIRFCESHDTNYKHLEMMFERWPAETTADLKAIVVMMEEKKKGGKAKAAAKPKAKKK